jgi:hypothetical protein
MYQFSCVNCNYIDTRNTMQGVHCTMLNNIANTEKLSFSVNCIHSLQSLHHK